MNNILKSDFRLSNFMILFLLFLYNIVIDLQESLKISKFKYVLV